MKLQTINSKITKDILKEHRTEEEYMSFYLGIIPDKDLHTNPLRPDNRPTASFYRSISDELIFKDWKTGFHGNFIDVVMQKYGVIYPKALDMIAQDFGLLPKIGVVNKPLIKYDGSTVTHKAATHIQCELQDFSESQKKWWLSFGITESTLKKFNVFSVKSVFINGVYSPGTTKYIAAYGYYSGKESGRELWKIYFPRRSTHRFLLNHNKLQGLKQLPPSGDILVVTKSLKDVMCLYEMGIPAVAPQAESVTITKLQYEVLNKRFKTIIFNGDWDRAGQMFMINSRKRYGGIALTFKDAEKYGKDVTDFTKKHGFKKANMYIQMIRGLILKGIFNKK